MSYKACVYKGCDNYTYNSTPCANKEFTIFRFPRDPVRYEQWMKRGKVLDGLPERQMLMCSDHFEDKYLIRNNKRTMLTSTAVPFYYPEENEDVECDDNEKGSKNDIVKVSEELDTEMVFSIHGDMEDGSELITLKETLCEDDNEDEIADYDKVENLDEEYCVESTMKDDDEHENEIADEYTMDSDYQDNMLEGTITQSLQKGYIIKSYKTKPPGRHKTSSGADEAQEPSSSKIVKTKISTQSIASDNAPALKRNMKQRVEETHNSKRVRKEIEENQPESPEARSKTLVNSEAVTCFIFKGEEYVQMPKEYYLQEKLELIEKLDKYEKVLRIFKQNLLDFEYS